ncbi:methylthioribulose 1-phosphate dehydratase [Actinomadura sp. NEAU-AAG7]|uniref:methylthioribulose 1-phosphate dehydratase n=1 Tax=Actinomadura sp. NEAU-AAG7 TaxID=2839640 RepID=UPI001BE4CD4D|nr:methylthioribulose 1-phosphate dehydratase [Actinomadura sp. NEAU-AAG7]MBT2210160.1 methylthioribulose 1-phosphate dehydratase [Actinomadura sp. NEAU-AAG7]
MNSADLETVPATLREHVAHMCRQLYGRGWMEGTSGNISVRSGDAVLISASGCAKGTVDRRDTVLVNAGDGSRLTGETRRPSAETAVHLAFYREYEDCGAVIHAHAPYSTALASLPRFHRAGQDVAHVEFVDMELAKGLGLDDPSHVRVPVFVNWPEVRRIAADVGAFLRASPPRATAGLLIERHGVTTWGRDLDHARNRLECVEALSRLSLLMNGSTTI